MYDELTLAVGREGIDRLIAAHVLGGSHHRIPLLRAAKEGRIVMAEFSRDATVNEATKMCHHVGDRPALALLGDDDYASTGPEGFRVAKQLIAWSRGVVIHAAGGEASHYEAVVSEVVKHRRIVMIETSAAFAQAWFTLARPHPRDAKPVAFFLPRDGLHPVTRPVH